MSGQSMKLLTFAAAVALSGCTDLLSSNDNSIALPAAFQTMPVGFSANSNSFDEAGDAGVAFLPEAFDANAMSGSGGASNSGPGSQNSGSGHHGDGDRRDGFGRDIRGLLMGGGLGRDFIGALAFERGKGRGPFGSFLLSDQCTFSEATGRVTCPTRERHDLDVHVSFAFLDVNGVAQAKYDTGTTNSVNVQTSVTGTKTRHDGRVTSTVNHTSDRTVAGLATGSTQRTVNGVAAASEITTGTRDDVDFTATREAHDTTTGLVIPLVEGRPTIPSAGTVIRRMRVEIAKEGQDPVVRFRREQVTFDGSNVVQITITQDDITKNCTLTLPAKRLTCGE